MPEKRPDPEVLLKRVQEEERQQHRGKLKIYLGAAPGVGKTYTMLQDAIAKREQGLDVIVGVVESHGRYEIESLLKNLEIMPKQKVLYRDKQLAEFDLDGTLKRNPGLILIDEMAHTNVPGLRHTKRWQDIKEILDRGIDVYTTLNVQHVESLNDVVSQIIHARVKETVPNSMLELADAIELVDLPTEDLLKRMQDGKVYIPKQAELAAEHFFRKGNLSALRQLALQVTEERVGAQVISYRHDQGIQHIWPVREKLLVCVSANLRSAKLIRATCRMAQSLQAKWTAVHVSNPRVNQSEEARNLMIQNLRLAEQLGAETRILTAADFVKEIMHFAREQNVTKIVMGKHIRPFWKTLLFRSLADELIRNSGEIDVYIITGEYSTAKPATPIPQKNKFPWGVYEIALGIVAFITLINFFLQPYLCAFNLIFIYLLGVSVVGLFGFIAPALLAGILSILACAFFFIPPLYNFQINNKQYYFALFAMVLVSQIISRLTVTARRQLDVLTLAQDHTTTLHTLSKQLASTRGVNKLLNIGVSVITDIFNSKVSALLPEKNILTIHAGQPLDPKEQGVAEWVYDMGQTAGTGTDTLPFSDALYVPMLGSRGPIGVLRVKPLSADFLFTPEQVHLLESCANQVGLAIEVDRLQERTKKSELRTETNRARTALLQSVSHDLRTPVTAMMGSASTLIESASKLDAKKIKYLGKDIYLEAEQLNRLIKNLLQITDFEADAVKIQKKPDSITNLVIDVVNNSSKKLGKKPVNIHFAENLPVVSFDNDLLQEVLLNLIDNAVKFTTKESPIEIYVDHDQNKIIVSIQDRGPGIMPDEVDNLFKKFYRGRMLTSERGLGLGLALCHRIIKAHGGTIWAKNREDGDGAAFYFTLPV